MKIIINIFRTGFLLLSASFLLFSCQTNHEEEKNNEAKKNTFLKEGEFCFRANETSSKEYLHLKFQNSELSGTIYLEEEYNGKVVYSFTGKLTNDSVMEIRMHEPNGYLPPLQDWIFHFDGQNLILENSYRHEGKTHYVLIDCNKFPDTTLYATVEEIIAKEEVEFMENSFPICYESILADAMKHHNGWHEYLNLIVQSDSIKGIGVGDEDGVPGWEFDFSGRIKNDSIEVKVNYRGEGREPETVIEIWKYMDSESKRIIMFGENHYVNGTEYAVTECEDILKYYKDKLRKVRLSRN